MRAQQEDAQLEGKFKPRINERSDRIAQEKQK